MTAAPPAAETELKFALAIDDVGAFAALPFLAGIEGTRTAFWTTYFDTEDFALRRAGYSLRLRRSGQAVIQTLKGPSARGRSGLFSRAEHEREVEGDRLNIDAVAEVLPAGLYAGIAAALAPRFDYKVERQAWLVPVQAGAVTVSVDHGIVIAGERTAIVAEAEFETLSGNLEGLFHLARTALGHVALHVEPLTKAERGYYLATGSLDDADPAPAVLAGTSLDGLRREAGTLVRAAALARRRMTEDGGAEAIHDFRVALRRLRALIDLVDHLLPTPRLSASGRAARRGFRRLGSVRDFDLVLEALPRKSEDRARAEPLIAEGRAVALAHARRTIGGRRFAAGLFEVLAFASGVPPALDMPADDGLKAALTRLLDRRWTAIHETPAPHRLGPEGRHRLRKQLKRFRYTTELAREILDDVDAEAAVSLEHGLRRLQDRLGALNDRATVRAIGSRCLGRSLARTLGLRRHGKADAADIKAADEGFLRLAESRPYWR